MKRSGGAGTDFVTPLIGVAAALLHVGIGPGTLRGKAVHD